MFYFAGPIELSPSESALIIKILLSLLLVAGMIFCLFAFSINKTTKNIRTVGKNLSAEEKMQHKLTVGLPLLTLASFVAWVLVSMATKEARYTSTAAVAISSVTGWIVVCLFVLSAAAAVYNLIRK